MALRRMLEPSPSQPLPVIPPERRQPLYRTPSERARAVIAMRNQGLLLHEIGSILGVSKQRISQIIKRASR